jgi:two-component sensor histidine kinase
VASPRLKADERYQELSKIYVKNGLIGEWEFYAIERELKNDKSIAGISALSLAYATYNRLDDAASYIEAYLPYGDAAMATLYFSFLFRAQNNTKINQEIYEFADKFQTKWFTINAAATAYTFGKLSLCGEFMNKHIKLLSPDEGREKAIQHRDVLLNDMRLAYEASGCSSEQYQLIAELAHKILRDFKVSSSKLDISGKSGGSYVMEVKTDSAKEIVSMNRSLAEAICMEERLDGCNLIARFSPDRNLKPEIAYVYR